MNPTWQTHALPIDAVLQQLDNALESNNNVVLQAPPGAGKTTRVPLKLLDAPWLKGKQIIMLEPRRLAARTAARRLADELGERVGETVGYRIRFEKRVSARTRIEVVTEGILTNRLQRDPELTGVGLVILDEFHERHLQMDLSLALCIDSQSGLRDDLRLLIMSATLDSAPVAHLLDAPIVTSEGRAYPVDIRYLSHDPHNSHNPHNPQGALPEVTCRAVLQALAETEGDILVFLPGAGEIKRTHKLLSEAPTCRTIALHTLYGEMSMDAQQAAINPDSQGRRKVVLATNIAETSLTIEGVHVVVDSGFARVPRFDPNTALTRLELVRIARSNADQRTGRAGRLGPGICYRLWGDNTQRGLIQFAAPEIVEADLAPLALELAQWGVTDPNSLAWLDQPPQGALRQAHDLLKELGALDRQKRITPSGREMLKFPLHPRLAHLLREGKQLGLGALACEVAAILSERDPFRGPARDIDLGLRVEALHAFRHNGREAARRLGADPNGCANIERIANQYKKTLRIPANQSCDTELLGLLLAFAYPDRIAQLRDESERLLLANGHGARLPQESHLRNADYIVAAVLSRKGDESFVRLAADVELVHLRDNMPERIESHDVVRWDAQRNQVVALREERLGAVVLNSKPLPNPSAEAICAAMIEAIHSRGLRILPWSKATHELRARILFLRHWFPDDGWPDLSDDALLSSLEQWLAPYLTGITRQEQLSRLNLHEILLSSLDWSAQQRLNEGAPTHITVPSGSRKQLEYHSGESPVLSVKLQEMFGLAETPHVGFGKVPVTLHLLSPAQRPIQVTKDLKSFWEHTYAEVKRELKGRYPKHPWPDDPWQAVPTARTKRKS